MKTIIHVDIGDSPSMAAVLGTKPFVEFLCSESAASGDSIRDSLIAIEQYGDYPAATTCSHCKTIAQLVGQGVALKNARQQITSTIKPEEEKPKS